MSITRFWRSTLFVFIIASINCISYAMKQQKSVILVNEQAVIVPEAKRIALRKVTTEKSRSDCCTIKKQKRCNCWVCWCICPRMRCSIETETSYYLRERVRPI